MNYELQLQEINNKYYGKIKNAYGCYIKNFAEIPDMTKGIVFLSENECIGEHKDLKFNRAKCDANTGIIYICKDKFNEHLLVHEFVHRLSRNKINEEYILGIDYDFNSKFLNELITEWIVYKICGKEKYNYNNVSFYLIGRFYKSINESELLTAYFTSNIQTFKQNINLEYCCNIIKNNTILYQRKEYMNLFLFIIKHWNLKN